MHRWQWGRGVVGLLAALTLLLAACSSGDDGGSGDSGSGSATGSGSAASSDWQAGGGAEWTKVLDAGRQEGEVVVAGFPALAEPMTEAFEKDTGIKLRWLGGSGSDNSARLEQEARAKRVTIDALLGGGRELQTLKPEGLLEPVKPQLILPSTKDGPGWQGGKTKWYDNEGQYLLITAEWVFGWPVVNADRVDPATIKTWNDLLKPELKGKIVAYDPTTNGPGQGASGFMAQQLGMPYLSKLFVDQDVTFVRDNDQLMQQVARGTKPVGLFAIQSVVEQFRNEGFNIEPILPEDEPGYLTSGFSVLKQAKGVPHPNAAKVFINWFASKRGQDIYASTMLEASRRADVEAPKVPDYVKPRDGVDYFDSDTEKFYGSDREKLVDQVTKLLGGR